MKNQSKSKVAHQRDDEGKGEILNEETLLTGKQIEEALLILRNPTLSQEGKSCQKEEESYILGKVENAIVDWESIVSEMFACMARGSRLNQLQNWMNSGRILSLCTIFKSPLTSNELKLSIVRLFDTMLSLQFEEEKQCQSNLGKFILQQSILFELLQLWRRQQLQRTNNIHILCRLIDRLLITDCCDEIMSQGGFAVLMDQALTMGKQNLLQQSQIDAIITTSSLLAYYLSQSSSITTNTKLYFVLITSLSKHDLIFSLLDELTLITQSLRFQSQLISILDIIFRRYSCYHILGTQSEKLYIGFVKYKNLFVILVEFAVVHQNNHFKQISWTIFALLTSSEIVQIQQLFVQIPFFDILIEAIQKIDNHPFNQINENIQQKILLCIGNLADYGDHMIKHIFNKQIINFLIDSALQTRSQKLKINSYYALTRFVRTSNPIFLNQIINKLPISDLLVHGLISCRSDQKLVQEVILDENQIFEGLNYLIGKNKELNNKQAQPLKDRLQAKYNLSFILELTQSKISKCHRLQNRKY